MRQTIKTVAIVAVIAAVGTGVHEDAGAAFYAYPLQPLSYAAPTQLTSYEIPIQTVSYEPLSQPSVRSGLPEIIAPFDLGPVGQPAEPQQSTSPPQSGRTLPDEPARQTQVPIVRIDFSAPALAPMAHTFFCLKYPNDCRASKIVFRRGVVKLTPERWAELKRINSEVNRAIVPERNNEGLAGEKWLISPKSGDCNDYAVTKRHELLARGWPARALLLSEVVVASGEHHLVLVVRTSDGDFVADNLNANIRPWSKTQYRWVRIQSPKNPVFWSTVARITVWANRTLPTDFKS